MRLDHPTTLTLDDHARVEQLMCTLTGSRSPLAALVRRKLASAVLIHPEAADGSLVTSGREIRFSVDGARSASGTLHWGPAQDTDAGILSLLQPRGLAMLGLRVGQAISFAVEDGIETVAVEAVNVPESEAGSNQRVPSPGTTSTPGIAARFRSATAPIVDHLKAALARIQKGRTQAVLMRLSDETLRDIGITRGDISSVADMVAGLAEAPSPGASLADPPRISQIRRRPTSGPGSPRGAHRSIAGTEPSSLERQRLKSLLRWEDDGGKSRPIDASEQQQHA